MQITFTSDEHHALQALRDRIAAYTGRYGLTLADTVRYALDAQTRRHNLPGWPGPPQTAPAAIEADEPPAAPAASEPDTIPDAPATPDYAALTVRELQALAGERGLDTGGARLKADWIALLEQEA